MEASYTGSSGYTQACVECEGRVKQIQQPPFWNFMHLAHLIEKNAGSVSNPQCLASLGGQD